MIPEVGGKDKRAELADEADLKPGDVYQEEHDTVPHESSGHGKHIDSYEVKEDGSIEKHHNPA